MRPLRVGDLQALAQRPAGITNDSIFKQPTNRLAIQDYREVEAIIRYDSELKSLLYSKLMFIETAVKNIVLEEVLNFIQSEHINDMFIENIMCT